MSLFITEKTPFYKTAAKLPLSDDNAMWGNEILAALYKQHPYLGRYEVNLQIDAQEPNLGAMSGSFLVIPASARRVSQDNQVEAGYSKSVAPDTQAMRIPVIVNGGKLHSFDVFISPEGKFYPLTEDRFAMMTAEAPAYYNVDPQIAAPVAGAGPDNMNPDVPNTGAAYGRGAIRGTTNTKTASVLSNIILADKVEYLSKVRNNKYVVKIAKSNEALAKSIIKMAEATERLEEPDIPNAFVIEKVAGGFETTHFSIDKGFTRVLLDNSAGEKLSDSVLEQVIKTGSAVIAPNNSGLYERDGFGEASIEQIENTGVYGVMSKTASEEDSLVFADVRGVGGDKTNLKMAFTTGGATLQQDIAGRKLDREFDLDVIKESSANGTGSFIVGDYITLPVKVTNRIFEGDTTSYLYEDHTGQRGRIKKASVNSILKIRDNDYLYPENAKFVVYGTGAPLLERADTYTKIASVSDHEDSATLHNIGGAYCVRGPAVAGVREGEREAISPIETSALLTALGGTADTIKKAMDLAGVYGHANFTASKSLDMPKVASASPSVDVTDIRLDLTEQFALILNGVSTGSPYLDKVANQLASQDSLDAVLSLNFVTPENIRGYVEMVPEYDQVLQRLAELLIGARLGLPDIPEGAVESAMRSLDRVVTGLNRLAERGSGTPEV